MSFNQKKLLFSLSVLVVSVCCLGFGPGMAVGGGVVSAVNS